MALLGELEQKVMNILWAAPKALKPAEVKLQLHCNLAYTTIMTVLKRLTDKKILKRTKMGKVYFYTPIVAKTAYAKNDLRSFFGNIINSYGDLAISQFVDSVKAKPEDLQMLKKYLEDKKDEQLP
jgi:predicted transcriptional regulator